jgi:8-oxo-dGTP pyrophosphatase MutT (NUDIX family)
MEKKLDWKLLKREQLFKDRWADIKVDTCEKPDGSIITPFYTYAFPDFATALAFTKDGQVILERIYRHGIVQTDFELPGGCVEATDSTLEAAMGRELLEETGYRFEEIEYLGKVAHNPSIHNNYMHMFLAKGGVFDPHYPLDLEEGVQVVLRSLEEVLDLLEKKQFMQAMQVSTLHYALLKMGKLVFR